MLDPFDEGCWVGFRLRNFLKPFKRCPGLAKYRFQFAPHLTSPVLGFRLGLQDSEKSAASDHTCLILCSGNQRTCMGRNQ